MVSYIKNSTDYGVFIVEGGIAYDGGADWLDGTPHIKEIDWDEVTEGANGIFLPYARRIKNIPNYKFNIITFFKKGVNISLGDGYWVFQVEGRFGGASEAARNTKMGNLRKLMNGHTSLADGNLYLGYRKPNEIWEFFPDPDDVPTPYIKGVMLSADDMREAQHNYYTWKISFRGVWL